MKTCRLAVTGWATSPAPHEAYRGSGFLPGSERREEPAVAALVPLARCCLAQARREPGADVALVLAVGRDTLTVNRAHARAVAAGSVSPSAFLYTTPNALTARVSILLGLTGESLTLPDPAVPFWAAADLLAVGRAAAVLVGGAGGGVAALLCVERLSDPIGHLLPGPALELLPPAPEGRNTAFGLSDAAVAEAAIRFLDSGLPGMVACGQRGCLKLHPIPLPLKDAAL